jgi:hypothetical protein
VASIQNTCGCDALPEGAELLSSGDRHHVEVANTHGIHGACDEMRAVASVGIGEAQDVAPSRPQAVAHAHGAEPSVRQRRVLDER